MPWGWFKWPEYLKKKACRYLLQHYLGNYLETKISLEDLTINLYNGTATVSNVPLSAEALNESLQNVNAPIRIVSGCIGEVNVTIPWKALIRDNCTVQISGLKLVVTPQVFSNYTTGAMMTESLLFSTMSASLQVAEELLKSKSEEEEKEAAGYEGMEAFARAIEIVLARVKVSLTDTVIQVNYENTDSSKLFLRLRIERIDFFDERSRIPSDEGTEVTVQDIAVKILELSKPLLEFGHESCEQDHINPSPLDTLTRLRQQQSNDSVESQVDETSGVLVGMASGQMEVKVKVKQTETVAGPKLEIEGFLAAIHFLFTHEDLLLLIEMINGIIKSSSDNQRVIPLHKYQHNIPGISRPMQMKDRDQVERQLQRHMERSRAIDHQRRDPWDLQSSGADGNDDFHSLEINACSDLTTSTVFTDPNTASVYSDTSASIYKSTFTIPPESPLSPDFPVQKPFAFKDPTKKITISSAGAFAMPDRGSPVSQKSFGGLQDTSVYKFTISCFTFALLHKKPYYKSVDVETSVDPEEYLSLNDRGELCPLTYFDSMSQAVLTGRVLKGSDPNDKISQVLPLDHLLLSAQTVNATVNVTGPSTKLHLSVGGTNIREYIYQNHLSRITKPVAIHSFITLTEDIHNIKPAVELNYSFTDDPEYKKKLYRFGKQFTRDGKVPEAKLGVELHSVHVELDPTLLDRLNISKIPSFSRQSSFPDSFEKGARSLYLPMSNANLHKQDYFDAAMGTHNSVKQQTTIVLTCNALDVMLKFPVPDLREAVSVKVCNQPKLRQEVCYADISSLMFKTCLDDSKLTKHELQLETLKAYLSASGRKEDRILFLLVEADRHDNNRVYSDLPRIVYESRTVLESELEDDLCTEEHNSMDDSSFLPSFNKKPSPFATSKTMFETSEIGKCDEWKEEVMPGSRDEIHQFEEGARDRASNVLKCFIPVLRLHLPNKNFYSKLYHRFGQDLPLWRSALVKQSDKLSTASVPSSLYSLTDIPTIYPLTDPMTDPMTQTIRPHHIQQQQQPLSFKPLRSEESSGEEDEDDGYVATVIPKQLQESKHNATTTVLSLVVGRAQLSLCTDLPCPTEVINIDEEKEKLVDVDSPKRTSSQSNVIGGIAVFDVTQFTVSSITGYNGDPTMDYLCLQIDKFNISHYSNFDMERFSAYSCVGDCPDVEKLLHTRLLPIITPAPGNMLVSGDCESHKRDPMLAIAMEVTSDPAHNTKSNKCAIAVRNGLLEYFVTPSELNCFTQLIQFFAIQNEKVPGYVPRPVVTALHVHFIDSTAVYRPKYLPWQIAFGVSAGHFSTTLASAATTSMMRLIIDESYIFLTNKPEKNLDLKQDYVCVVEIGLLEINIKMQTGDIPESLNIPEMSLEFSNNLIEFRTCVDTCAGLRDLIQYIASYGDLRDFVFVKARSFDSCKDETESADGFSTPLGSLTSNTSIPLPSGVNQMDLMDDAMEELAIENTGGNKRTDKVYKPSRDKRKSPGTKRKSSYKKPSTESKLKLSNPNLKSIKVPVNFSDSDDDSHGAVNKKMTTSKQTAGKFPLSPARSSMSSTVTSEESEDDFLILDLPISSKMAKGAKPVVKSYLNDDEIVKIEPNHFTPSNSFTDQLHRPENFPVPVTMYTLKDMNVVWYLYGGSDFQKSSTPSPASSSSDHSTSPATKHKDIRSRQEAPSSGSPTSQHINPRSPPRSTGSHLNSNSRYKRTSNTSDTVHYKKKAHKGRMFNWKVAGGPDRNHDIVMELHINKLRMQHEVYPEDKEQSSRFVLLVREIELVDRLAASQLNKFLSQYVSNTMPKQTHANMVSFKMLSMRTELEEYPEREEIIIHASALPLRLYVDQDALEFLMNFMADLSTTKRSAETPPAEVFEQPSPSPDQTSTAASTPDPVVEPPYFKEFSFYPSVVIKIDYEAKRFDMEKGVIPGILVGLSHLDSAEIELKSLKFCGVKGWDRLLSQVVSEWTGDVKSQLPKILGGIGPMHYLMQFAQGVVDFVWLPVQQYQQDGRVVRGLQRGATSLAASTGMATVELTTRLVQTIEFVAATTYDLVAPVEHNSSSSLALQRRRNPRRPQDFRSGVSSAWNTLTTGINDTAGDLYHTVTREHDEGVARTLGEVLRQVPGVVVRPILIASEATRHVLGGVRNQLMPDARKEELAKYRDDT